MSEQTRSQVSIGSGGNPVLRCSDCEVVIRDNVLGWSPSRLEYAAQDHRCDMNGKALYEANWIRPRTDK